MSSFEYPEESDWEQLAEGVDWNSLKVHELRIGFSDGEASDIRSLPKNLIGTRWLFHLQNRLADVFISYVMASFYLSRGIPDEPWYLSPGKSGNSVDYFPEFEEVHFTRKAQYDYYVDVFYYKLFAACDTLGHLLNTLYDLSIPSSRVYLGTAVDGLLSRNPDLHRRFKEIIASQAFQDAHAFRIAITHNSPPNEAGPLVASPTPTGYLVGLGSYTYCATFLINMRAVLGEFALLISLLKQEGMLEKPQKES